MERWKTIVVDGIETQYEISDAGRCRNTSKLHWKTRGILSPKFNKKNGYESYCIADPQLPKYKYMYAHRLVLSHFVPTENSDTLHVNHIDCNKRNNHLENLEWCTQEGNMQHAVENELIGKPVLQYTLSGEYIRRFSSATKAGEYLGIYHRSISQALLSEMPNAQSGGFQWRFEGGHRPVLNIESTHKSEAKPMVQLTLDNELVDIFSHSTLAYRKLGKIDNGYLARVATRENNVYEGYKWLYLEDYEAQLATQS